MEENLKKYIDISNTQDGILKDMEHKFSLISTGRILTFVIALVLICVGAFDSVPVALVAGIIIMLGFIGLVRLHNTVSERIEIAKSKQLVADRYVARFSDDWRKFDQNGKEYLAKEDIVAADIDMLGDNSLYQMISVCHTEAGKNQLAESMKLTKKLSDKELKERREAVTELVEDPDFAIDFEAAGVRLESRKKRFNPDKFAEYCNDENAGILPGWAKAVSIILPLCELLLIVLFIARVLNYGAPLLGFIIILSFSWLTKTVTDKVMSPLGNVNYASEDYLAMLEIIGTKDYNASILVDMKDVVAGEKGVIKAFSKLRQISQAYNVCFNPLIHQVLSGLILWDYQLARFVEKWKKQYGSNTAKSFSVIGDMEELLSLSVVGRVRETNWAEVNENYEKGVFFKCKDMYHPLIKPEAVQSNSASINNGITIITGSNMSGKTTFLRTMAINLALAYMGAPVCAKELNANYMKIFTSMRIADDVANGISTFYAEILRIKSMADFKNANNEPMLCLIDEIFKGTNSADRIVGAKEVIRRLSGKLSMTIVSTHDFELCDIKDNDGESATNYHFEEYYSNDELKFDYKIKDGRCTTTNAKAILRMAGFAV